MSYKQKISFEIQKNLFPYNSYRKANKKSHLQKKYKKENIKFI